MSNAASSILSKATPSAARDRPRTPPARELGARACTHKIAVGDGDLINVRFGPLCGLKSDISRGPRSAKLGLRPRGLGPAVSRNGCFGILDRDCRVSPA